MNDKMKKILIIAFTVAVVAIFGVIAFAGIESGGSSGGFGGGDKTSGYYFWKGPRTNGVRISFVNHAGKSYGTIDYIDKSNFSSKYKDGFYLTSERLSKPTYINRTSKTISFSNHVDYNSSSLKDIGTLEAIFDDKLGIKVNFSSDLEANTVSEILNSLVAKDTEQYKENITNFFETIIPGGKAVLESGEVNKDGVYDLFIIVEPTSLVSVDGKMIFGTFYEVAKYLEQLEPKKMEAAYYNLFNFIKKTFPCSVTLTGAFSKELQNNTKKFPWLESFEKGTYFEKININDGVLGLSSKGPVCEKANGEAPNKSEYAKENYAKNNIYGIGFAWLNSLITPPSPPKCEDVENFYIKKPVPIDLKKLDEDGIKQVDFSIWNKETMYQTYQITPNWYIENCGVKKKYTCKDVNEFKKYSRNKIHNKNDIDEDFFLGWNYAHPSHKYDKETFCKEGCCDSSTYSCNPSFSTSTCLGNGPKNIKYSDMPAGLEWNPKDNTNLEFWNNCVFDNKGGYTEKDFPVHKVSEALPNSNGQYYYYDTNLNLYCLEKVEAEFPTSPSGKLEPGSIFVWPQETSPVKIIGTRLCRTKPTDAREFLYEARRHNGEMKIAYAEWQLELAKKAEYDKFLADKDKYKTGKMYFCENGDCTTNCTATGHEIGSAEQGNICNTEGYNIKANNGITFDKNINTGISEYYMEYDYTWPIISCESIKEPKIDVNKYEARYKNQQKNYKNLKKQIEKERNLKTIEKDIIDGFKFYPDLTLDFSDGIVGKYSYQNSQPLLTTSYSPEIKYFEFDEIKNTNILEVDIITDCNLKYCNYDDNIKVQSFNSKGAEVTKKFTYRIPYTDNSFKYIRNSDALSVTKKIGKNNTNENYKDAGFHLPVAFVAKPGVYGENQINGGQLTINYSKIGYKYGNGDVVFDKLMDELSKSNDAAKNHGKWACKYEVGEPTGGGNPPGGGGGGGGGTPPPGGGGIVDVIYREIDLANPFPDINGSGRNTGSNWCYGDNCSNNNSNKLVKDVILNNRNTADYRVYQKQPMYSFVLTPRLVSQIKRYNRDHSYHEFDKASYTCQDGSGKYCISNFLTNLINNDGTFEDAKASGACIDLQSRSTEPSHYDSCKYK